MKLTKFIANRIEDSRGDSLDSDIQTLTRYYHPAKGRISSWLEAKRSGSKSNLIVALTREQTLLVEQAANLEIAALNSRKRKAEFHTFIAEHAALFIKLKADSKREKKAAKKGLSVEGLEKANLSILDTKLTIKENAEAHRLDTEKREADHRRDMEKKQREFDNEIEFAYQELKFALIADHLTDQQQMILIQDLIDQQYRAIDKTLKDEVLDEHIKKQMIKSRHEMIDLFTEQRNGKTVKHLQEGNGTKL